MTRVLFACWPFESHIFPQLSLALALRERGVDVAFHTDGSKRALIEEQGFEVFPFERVPPAWERVHGRRATGRREPVFPGRRAPRPAVSDPAAVRGSWDRSWLLQSGCTAARGCGSRLACSARRHEGLDAESAQG